MLDCCYGCMSKLYVDRQTFSAVLLGLKSFLRIRAVIAPMPPMLIFAI